MHICANLVRQNVDDQGCIKAWKGWMRQRICIMYSRPLIDWPFGIISDFCHSFTLYNNKGFQSSWPHHSSQSHAWWSLKLIIMIMTITMVWHPTLRVPYPEEDCQVRVTVSFLSLLWLQTSALITLWITFKKNLHFWSHGHLLHHFASCWSLLFFTILTYFTDLLSNCKGTDLVEYFSLTEIMKLSPYFRESQIFRILTCIKSQCWMYCMVHIRVYFYINMACSHFCEICRDEILCVVLPPESW